MKREESLARGAAYLDEATENLTFEEFSWAFEEVWHGVGWVLNALSKTPKSSLELGKKGELPIAGTLAVLLAAVPNPPRAARVAGRLEALRSKMTRTAVPGDGIADLVFAAWELHDVC
ncbi:MAG: hypothetical protein ACNA8W_16465, partial [Bradymonadaceae bacterium]